MTTEHTRAIGYIRVSTGSQAEDGVSLAAQREKLTAYAVAMDLDLVCIIEDAGVSAKSLRRPGLESALAILETGKAEALLVTKLDRLTRSVRDLGNLIERYFTDRCSLLSVGDSIDTRTAAGRLILNVLTSVAQWEREATGERTRDALRHLKSQGVKLGGPALGWSRLCDLDASGRRVVSAVDEEAETIDRIVFLRNHGLTLRTIAMTLTDEGRPTKRGGAWAAETVRKVLGRVAA